VTYSYPEPYFIFRSKHTSLARLSSLQATFWRRCGYRYFFATLLIVRMTLRTSLRQSFFSEINTNAMRKVHMRAWMLRYTMLHADVIIQSKLRPRY